MANFSGGAVAPSGVQLLAGSGVTFSGTTTSLTITASGSAGSLYPAPTIPVDGDFAWITQDGASTTVNGNGGISLTKPAHSGLSVAIRKKAAPATPYTLTAALFGNMLSANFQDGGLCLRDATGGKFILFGFRRDSGNIPLLVIQRYNSATSFSATAASLSAGPPGGLWWLRVLDDGTNRKYSYSMDGYSFVQVLSETRVTFTTTDEIGFCVSEQTNVYAMGLTVISFATA
jgi:hypothetical protein